MKKIEGDRDKSREDCKRCETLGKLETNWQKRGRLKARKVEESKFEFEERVKWKRKKNSKTFFFLFRRCLMSAVSVVPVV